MELSVLRKLEIFDNISENGIERLCRSGLRDHIQITAYEKHTVLAMEGSPIESLCFVLEGQLKTVNSSADGDEWFVHYFDKGSVVALSNYFSGQPYMYTICSAVHSHVLSLDSVFVDTVFAADPEVSRVLIRLLAEKGHASYQTAAYLRIKNVRRRLCRFLLYRGGSRICLPMSQTEMARLLGINRSVLNTELHALQREGVIALGNGVVDVLRPDLLRKLAGELGMD